MVLGNDGLVYACDRQGNRIQVFDRVGTLKRVIVVAPPGTSASGGVHVERSVSDIAFSRDREQKLIFVAYYGCGCLSPESENARKLAEPSTRDRTFLSQLNCEGLAGVSTDLTSRPAVPPVCGTVDGSHNGCFH